MSPARSTPDTMHLLRAVSRSFYLSIRLLPPALRRPIAVAYLLARATDTIADTARLAADVRQQQLRTLAGAIQGDAGQRAAIPQLCAAFAPLQSDASEKELIHSLPACLALLDGLMPADREDVQAVLREITRGQMLDVERFGAGARAGAGFGARAEVHALANAAELDEYTWLVAGCVGAFWTALCLRHVEHFASLPAGKMRALGIAYGKGLQLINILRDCGDDLAALRCYFPADELATVGLAPGNVRNEPQRFTPVFHHWCGTAQENLAQGMEYVLAINNRRVRAASALPALIGARTLALLREAGPDALMHRVKVPRSEVRAVLARTAFTLAGRASLAASFERLMGQSGP